MIKRLTAWLLAAVMLLSAVPQSFAFSDASARYPFPKKPTHPLPDASAPGLLEEAELPKTGYDGFIRPGFHPLKANRDGFLAEPSGPVASIRPEGVLLKAPGAPEADAVAIGSADELFALRDTIAKGGSYVLTADIDLTGRPWESIPMDSAAKTLHFDGQGHKLTGLTLTGRTLGMFSNTVPDTRVCNLVIGTREKIQLRSGGVLFANARNGAVLDNCRVDFLPKCTIDFGSQKFGILLGANAAGQIDIRSCYVYTNLYPWDDASIGRGNVLGGVCAAADRDSRITVADSVTYLSPSASQDNFDGIYGVGRQLGSSGGEIAALTVERSQILIYLGSKPAPAACLADTIAAKESVNLRDSVLECRMDMPYTRYELHLGCAAANLSAPVLTADNVRTRGTVQGTGVMFGGLFGKAGGLQETDPIAVTMRNVLAGTNYVLKGNPEYYNRAAGGLIGQLNGSAELTDCMNSGSVSLDEPGSHAHIAAGLIGSITDVGGEAVITLTNCVNEGRITAPIAGGLIGCAENRGGATLTNCENRGDVTSPESSTSARNYPDRAAGLIASGRAVLTNCRNAGEISGKWAAGLIWDGGSGKNFPNEITLDSCSSSIASGIEISAGLAGSADVLTVKTCIGSVGTYASTGNASLSGIAYRAASADIRNCEVYSYLQPKYTGNIGGILLSADGQAHIRDCYVDLSGTVGAGTNERRIGGILACAGYKSSVTLHNCAARMDVTVADPADGAKASVLHMGGMIGVNQNNVTMTLCRVSGLLQGQTAVHPGGIGGMIGKVEKLGTTTAGQCLIDAEIGGAWSMGGVIGWDCGSQTLIYSCLSRVNAHALYADHESGGMIGSVGFSHYNDSSEGHFRVEDCAFEGTFAGADGTVGGMVGRALTNHEGEIVNCVSKGNFSAHIPGTSSVAGGILGQAKATVSDCVFRGSILRPAEDYPLTCVGGIAGKLDKNGTITNCEAEAELSGGMAGGILGSISGYSNDFSIRNCTASGSVRGSTVGGIAGFCALIADCTVSTRFGVDTNEDCAVGGIVGQGNRIYRCTVTDPVKLIISLPADTASSFPSSLCVGGIVGKASAGEIVDCTVPGVYLNGTFPMRYSLGGLVGESSGTISQNCLVDGSVIADVCSNCAESTGRAPSCYVGGIGGEGGISSDEKVTGTTVAGNVHGQQTGSRMSVLIGGFYGHAYSLYVDGSVFGGKCTFTPKDGGFVHLFPPLLGNTNGGPGVVDTTVPDTALPEPPEESYRVQVLEYVPETMEYLPLPGAEVLAAGVPIGFSGADGTMVFKSDVLRTPRLVLMEGRKADYFDGSNYVMLADGGSTTLVLKRKTPGEIYFKGAYYLEEGRQDILTPYDSIRVLQDDETDKKVVAYVDWNDLDEENRSLRLINEKGNTSVILKDGVTEAVSFYSMFRPNERIYLLAEGTKDGNPVRKKALINITVEPLIFHLPVDGPDTGLGSSGPDDNSGLYFLKGAEFGFGVGDIKGFAGDISIKNGVLSVLFGGDIGAGTIPAFKWGSTEFRTRLMLDGKVEIPVSKKAQQGWAGEVILGYNDDLDLDTESIGGVDITLLPKDPSILSVEYPFIMTFPFPPFAAPCFFESSIGLGAHAKARFSGTLHDPKLDGEIAGKLYGSMYAGVGGGVPDKVEVKVGSEGELFANPRWIFESEGVKFYSTMELSGRLNAKFVIKAFVCDVEGKLRLGSFKWNGKDPVEWHALGVKSARPEILSMEQSAWRPLTRDYLQAGGGFRRADISAYAFDPSGASRLRYGNIGEQAEALLCMENGVPVLYFTADDGTPARAGESIAAHTSLWRTELQSGTWTEPVMLSNPGGFPSTVFSDNGAVIWAESTDTASMESMVNSSRIRVSLGGKVYDLPSSGYVHNPRISAKDDGTAAKACWYGVVGKKDVLYSSDFANGAWSEPEILSAGDQAEIVSAWPSCTDDAVYVLTDKHQFGGIRYNFIYGGNHFEMFHENILRVAEDQNVFALFDADGGMIMEKVTVWNKKFDREWIAAAESQFNGASLPSVVGDRNCYAAVWAQPDGVYMAGQYTTHPVCLVKTDRAPSNVTAIYDGSNLHISYTLQNADTGANDLFTRTFPTEMTDLSLDKAECLTEKSYQTGAVQLRCHVSNNGTESCRKLFFTVTDAEGNAVCKLTSKTQLNGGEEADCYLSFVPTTETYTVSVTSDSRCPDMRPEDNSRSVDVPLNRAKIRSASFLPDYSAEQTGAGQLEVLVQNTGVNELAELTVTVTPDNGTPTETVFTAVPTGSSRQVLTGGMVPGTLYTVTLSTGGVVLDQSQAIYEDPFAEVLVLKDITFTATGAEAQVIGEHVITGPSTLALAFYEKTTGRFLSMGTCSVSALEGENRFSFTLNQPLPESGEWLCKLFFLAPDGSTIPLRKPISTEVVRP